MIKEFRASDGTLVWTKPSAEGDVNLGNYMTLSPKEAQALREFFRHERDEELGRWRWPENPDYVVARCPKNDGNGNDGRAVWALNERDSMLTLVWENTLTVNRVSGENASISAARWFFADHPESKPWHDAKPGEVWVITDKAATLPSVVTDDLRFETREGFCGLHCEDIIDARRIWPEPSNG